MSGRRLPTPAWSAASASPCERWTAEKGKRASAPWSPGPFRLALYSQVRRGRFPSRLAVSTGIFIRAAEDGAREFVSRQGLGVDGGELGEKLANPLVFQWSTPGGERASSSGSRLRPGLHTA